jgi:hypothetical protein
MHKLFSHLSWFEKEASQLFGFTPNWLVDQDYLPPIELICKNLSKESQELLIHQMRREMIESWYGIDGLTVEEALEEVVATIGLESAVVQQRRLKLQKGRRYGFDNGYAAKVRLPFGQHVVIKGIAIEKAKEMRALSEGLKDAELLGYFFHENGNPWNLVYATNFLPITYIGNEPDFFFGLLENIFENGTELDYSIFHACDEKFGFLKRVHSTTQYLFSKETQKFGYQGNFSGFFRYERHDSVHQLLSECAMSHEDFTVPFSHETPKNSVQLHTHSQFYDMPSNEILATIGNKTGYEAIIGNIEGETAIIIYGFDRNEGFYVSQLLCD